MSEITSRRLYVIPVKKGNLKANLFIFTNTLKLRDERFYQDYNVNNINYMKKFTNFYTRDNNSVTITVNLPKQNSYELFNVNDIQSREFRRLTQKQFHEPDNYLMSKNYSVTVNHDSSILKLESNENIFDNGIGIIVYDLDYFPFLNGDTQVYIFSDKKMNGYYNQDIGVTKMLMNQLGNGVRTVNSKTGNSDFFELNMNYCRFVNYRN